LAEQPSSVLKANAIWLLRRGDEERDGDLAGRSIHEQAEERAGRIAHRESATRRRSNLDVDGKRFRAAQCKTRCQRDRQRSLSESFPVHRASPWHAYLVPFIHHSYVRGASRRAVLGTTHPLQRAMPQG
jgi:hypothetical protein